MKIHYIVQILLFALLNLSYGILCEIPEISTHERFEKKVSSVITYKIPIGRLGDCLITYCKAKWISYKQNLPLLFMPFNYSDQLVMHQEEQHFQSNMLERFKMIVILKHIANFNLINKYDATLYLSKFNFFIDEIDKSRVLIDQNVPNPTTMRMEAMLKEFKRDQGFLQVIRQMIRPIAQLKKIYRPLNKISVAVHVRRGGGFDAPLYVDLSADPSAVQCVEQNPVTYDNNRVVHFADQQWPLKFPPDSFYIDQIKTISAMFNHKPLYIYIFTDDQNPEKIVQKYRETLQLKNLEFACRVEENSHDAHVLDDLFGMAEFDCLIRPHSQMSRISHIIGNHQVVIFPMASHWEGNSLIIDDIQIMTAPTLS